MNFVIIGNGKMCIDCIGIMLNNKNVKIPLVLFSKHLDRKHFFRNYLIRNEINFKAIGNLKSEVDTNLISKYKPDYILNISSFWIIKTEILSIPKIATINFHNGPLPKYGGVNIPYWAILNGERVHGVTWHIIDEGIDTGDILWQKKFEFDENFTAGFLMSRCIKEGIELFENNFMSLLDQSFVAIKQKGKRTYYSLKDKPPKSGIINFNESFNTINNLVRGLNYIPFLNSFCYSTIKKNKDEIIVNKISKIRSSDSIVPGTIMRADLECIYISCKDSIIKIESAMNKGLQSLENEKIISKLKIKVGDILN